MHQLNMQIRLATPTNISQSNSLVLLFLPLLGVKISLISVKKPPVSLYSTHRVAPMCLVRILERRKSADFNVDFYRRWAHRNRQRRFNERQFFAIKHAVTGTVHYTDTNCNICAHNFRSASILGNCIFVTYSFQTGLGECPISPAYSHAFRP
jgi:hypothetical protein